MVMHRERGTGSVHKSEDSVLDFGECNFSFAKRFSMSDK